MTESTMKWKYDIPKNKWSAKSQHIWEIITIGEFYKLTRTNATYTSLTIGYFRKLEDAKLVVELIVKE